MNSKKGFTLIELLCVIALLSILSLLAVPNVINTIYDSKVKALIIQERQIADASAIFVKDYCDYPLSDEYSNNCNTLFLKSEAKVSKNVIEKYVCLNNLKDIEGNKYYADELKFNDTLCNGFVVYQYNKDDNKQISKNTYVTCGEEYISEAIANGTIDLNNYPNCNGVSYPTKYKYVVYHDNNTGETKTDCLYDKLEPNGAKEGCVASSAYKIKSNLFTKKYYVLDYWTTDQDGSGSKIELNSNSSKLPFSGYNNEEIHLYANWKLDIDRQAPVITINTLPSKYSLNTQQITGTINDELGGLVSGNISYALTTTKTTPTSGWKDTSKSKIDFFDLSATSNSTYYVHAKDKQGNTSYKSVSVSNIVWQATANISDTSASSSKNFNRYTGKNIKQIVSTKPYYGSINSSNFNGQYLVITGNGQYTLGDYTSKNAIYLGSANYDMGSPVCDSGSYYDSYSGMCVTTDTIYGSNPISCTAYCNNGRPGASYGRCIEGGGAAQAAVPYGCTSYNWRPGFNSNSTCYGTYYYTDWVDYSCPTVSKTPPTYPNGSYYCNNGYLNGSSCYTCDEGYYSNGYCVYRKSSYYKYNYDITYYYQ